MQTIRYTSLKPEGYIPRQVDYLVQEKLEVFGAVEIRGTRWCGKSWTAAAFSNSITRVDDALEIYRADPSVALVGETPHAIDEWQDVPAIWNRARHAVDDGANKKGRFVLTGSSTPREQEGLHSGAGRIARVRMRTMTLAERGLSTEKVSLQGLFKGEFEPSMVDFGLEECAQAVCQGGWPALLGSSEKRARETVDEYLALLFDESMRKLGRNPILARRLAQALARNLGASATLKTLAEDAASGDVLPSPNTLAGYLADFKLNYFLDELPGWDAPVKARSRVRTKPKRYLDDPSMAASLLRMSSERLLVEGQVFGGLLEALCYHDLSVYASLLPDAGSVPLFYYADSDGLEVDFIIELRDGRWAALEVKLGESKVEQAANSLKRLRDKVARNPAARNKEPEFMAVLVGTAPYARQRKEDGIYVIPIASLTV